MLFGGVLWLDYLSLPWFPSCLDSRDPIGPQRPGQLPAGGKAQSPSPETEPVTSEQRRRALWLHLAFTQRVSPWPGQDFPSPQDARRGPGLSCREPTACYPGVVPGTRPGQSGAPGHKRRASSGSGGACCCPDHAGGDAEAAWRGRCSSALRRLPALLRTALRARGPVEGCRGGANPRSCPCPGPPVSLSTFGGTQAPLGPRSVPRCPGCGRNHPSAARRL